MAVIGTVGSAGMKKQKFGEVMKRIVKMTYPYWVLSEEKWASLGMLLINIFMMVFNTSFVGVRMAAWNADWLSSFSNKNAAQWIQQMLVFIVVGVSQTMVQTFNGYISSWISIRWRRWMTARYLKLWMENSNHYKMQLSGNETDNPDQRITEDITQFISFTWMYSFSFVQNILSFVTYTVILWNQSAIIPLKFGLKGGFDGHGDFSVPGHFLWIAILWTLITTGLTHWIGKPMTRLTFDQQMYDANFRFSLVRFRENSEQIALLKGEEVEHARLMGTLGDSITNQFRTMGRTMRMGWVSAVLAYGDMLMFSFLLGPAFFYYGAIPDYGTYTYVAGIFLNVTNGLKWFQTNYSGLAAYIAVTDRLYAFNSNYENTIKTMRESQLQFRNSPTEELEIHDLDVYLPYGKLQISAKDFTFKHGEKILIKGRTGAGKTTLFRVLSGIWPYAKGDIALPNTRVIVLPQNPYFPIGSLIEAISYPEPPDTYKREDIQSALKDVGLTQLVDRIDEVGHWNMQLSGGEQQRAGIARAMLYKPDYLFFDEATASMDEPSEEELYSMLLERMKETTIISIGHRSSLQKFHERLIFAEGVPGGSYEFQERDIKSFSDAE
ncbi:MAG: ABC transporter ATP-binding protein/permease [Oscillospiraceae bacterium]|jgi:putative ATP-binding cassette transporter|nr:ABC transporter ATP-binding protein/permease [Oscillospiraceae bacterium]